MTDIEAKISNYSPPANLVEQLKGIKLVFLVGITAAGKDTIAGKLFASGRYTKIISHTTRLPRENDGVIEVEGVNYYFVDMPKIESMVDKEEFFELKYNHGKVYGTSLMALAKVRDSGKIGLSDIDVQGVSEYMSLLAGYVTPVFILPPDYQTWQRRFNSRYDGSGGVADKERLVRLQTAESELKDALTNDYFEFVINDDLARAVEVVDQIAHGQTSRHKNTEAKSVAEQLLSELRRELVR